MASTYIPTAIRHRSLVLPSPGDLASALTLNATALKFLGDNDQYLEDYIGRFTDGTNIVLPTGSIFANQGGVFVGGPIAGGSTLGAAGDITSANGGVRAWLNGEFGGNVIATGAVMAGTFMQAAGLYTQNIGLTPAGDPFGWELIAITGAQIGWTQDVVDSTLTFPITPPNVGATMHLAICTLNGGGGTRPFLPFDMPILSVLRQDINTTGYTVLGSATDPSATLAEYVGVHTFTTSEFSHATDSLSSYYIQLRGEGGAGSEMSRLKLINLRVIWSGVKIGT